jgi:carboxypeptidase C (cathepsin A)
MFVWALCVAALAVTPAFSQEHGGDKGGQSAPAGPGVLSLLPADSSTDHTLQAGGETLAYTATAGTFTLYDQNGERSAKIFYTAYALKDARAEARPVTFVFNGGPGAASTYLHLGLAGPRIVDFGANHDGAAAALRDNPDTWLKFTDLVFIDPVGTGWSRAAKADKTSGFWNVRADAQMIAKVVALYIGKNRRSGSPKYLLGESYGGFRSLKVARTLQQEQGLVVNGIVMVSPFLEGGLLFNANRFALGAALQLPSLAAAELDRKGKFTPEALAAAERFAMTEYLTTLAGAAPQGEAAERFYAKVAELTGVPIDTVRRTRGFVRDRYEKVEQGRESFIASPYDAAALTPDPYPEAAGTEGDDPILDGYLQALGGAFVGYAGEELRFKTPMTFNLLNREIAGKWDWGAQRRGQASAVNDLREMLGLNPKFRVLIAHGRSDMVVPYAATRYVIDHLPPIGAPGRVALKVYRGGHMFYFAPDVRGAIMRDAAAFYQGGGT